MSYNGAMRIISALVVCVSLILAACGGDSDSSSDTTAPDSNTSASESSAVESSASESSASESSASNTSAPEEPVATSEASVDTEAPVTTAAAVETTDAPEEPTTTAAAVETTDAPEEPATTAAPVETTSTTAPTTTAAPETTVVVASNTYDAVLGSPEGGEFSLGAPNVLAAGNITFAVTNEGSFPHNFAMVAGNQYDQLPLRSNGQPDEEALRNAGGWFGVTELLNAGDSTTIDLGDVPAGNYVLFCNIAVGASSHAAQGQTLSVTVG